MVFIQKTQKKAMSVLPFPIPVNSCAWSTLTAWIFLGFLFATACISCAYNYNDLPSNNSSLRSSHIWFSYIYNFIIILSRIYHEPIQRPAPSWLVSSIGRALHQYRRGQGFESRTSLSFRNCISCLYNCDDLLSNNSSLRSSNIWFSYIFITSKVKLISTNQKHCE